MQELTNLLTKGWTTGAYARNKKGESVDPNSPLAVSWSLDGAIEKLKAFHIVDKLFDKYGSLVKFNDSSTKLQVLAAVRSIR